MRLGELRHTLQFQAPTKDANGVVGWQTAFTCKGSFWGLSGEEGIVAQQMGGNITGKVRIMYRPIKIKTSWRIVVDGNIILNIAGPPINLGGEQKYLEIKVRQTE